MGSLHGLPPDMTSCSAAEVPAASDGAGMDSAKLTSKHSLRSTFSDVLPGLYAEAINYCSSTVL